MKTNLLHSLVALLALGFVSASAAPKSHVKARGTIVLSATLQPAANAPAGITASAEIVVSKAKFNQDATATLTLTTSGFPQGDYSLDGLLKDGTTAVHLGDFTVGAVAPVNPTPDQPITFTLDGSFDATQLASLSISDSTPQVILQGDVTETSVNWQFIANVQVTGPNGERGKPHSANPVFGHVVAQSFVKDSVETTRHFLWVAFGAPASTDLTINVDGVAVGTVTSTERGKVMFHELDASVVLRDVKLITLSDGTGAVIMQAQF